MSETKTLHQKLVKIQTNLVAPKDAWNGYANYAYRSAESILKAVKPHLAEQGLVLTLSDQIKEIGGRVYVEATATISDGENQLSVTAQAREPQSKKGADESQITGAASSYARKYALCGLFAIDDNKDADAVNDHSEPPARNGVNVQAVIADLERAENLQALQAVFGAAWNNATDEQRNTIKARYDQIKADFLAAEQT